MKQIHEYIYLCPFINTGEFSPSIPLPNELVYFLYVSGLHLYRVGFYFYTKLVHRNDDVTHEIPYI